MDYAVLQNTSQVSYVVSTALDENSKCSIKELKPSREKRVLSENFLLFPYSFKTLLILVLLLFKVMNCII